MITNDVNRDYFQWMCDLISDSKPSKGSYGKLFKFLNETEFIYTIPMDGNRYDDGINLRYRFGYDHDIEYPVIASCLDNRPCSVFEMMVALAFRCDEQITFNPANGLRAGRWFWMMIKNLGLEGMTDSRFDIEHVNSVIWRFLDREYTRDGEGGLIYIKNSPYDMRTMEIWYQLQHYLSQYGRNGV